MTSPVQPQARAVAIAPQARLAAPRTEAAFPPRSRVAATTGAESRGADRRDQRVQAADLDLLAGDLGDPEPGALLGVAEDALLRGVDAGERQALRAAQQPRLARQPDQEPPAGLLQLGDVPPVVAAQVGAERGRGPDPAEHRAHRAVPQHPHVIDAVGPGGHPGDQAAGLQIRVRPAGPARADVAGDQVLQAGPLREGQHGNQAGVRHRVRVVEQRSGPGGGVR
jgi:hypothetical protein